MRDIKFRGKRLDNGEWVFGDIWQHNGRVDIVDNKANMFPVDPETVGQLVAGDHYTGDVFSVVCDCDCEFGCGHPAEKYELIWHERYCQYGYKRGNRFELLDYFGEENVFKCGNIHDNPELLQPQGGNKE